MDVADSFDFAERATAHAKTTSEEPLDVLDETGSATGQQLARREVHARGLWHAAVHLWLVDSRANVIVQRRSRFKDLSPGRIDVSVGGHVRAGESWPQTLREAEEELGVPVDVMDVRVLGSHATTNVHDDGSVDREHLTVLAAMSDVPLHHYLPDAREVETLYAVPLDRALALWRDGTFVAVEGHDAAHRRADAILHEGDLIAQARTTTTMELEWLHTWWQESGSVRT